MRFYPLDLLKGFFNNGNEYYKTYKLPQTNLLLTGQPEFLNPDTWNAYNIFATTPQLYAVISRKGHLLSSGKWKHYKKISGKLELVENSEVVKLLENPNALISGNNHLMQMNENICVYGNNYEFMLKAFDNQEIPNALSNIPPTQVGIKTTGKIYKQSKIEDIVKYYEVKEGDVVVDKIEPNDLIHSRIVNILNPIKGDSPLRSLFMPISNIRSAYQFRNVIMNKRGAIGLISGENREGSIPLNAEERKRLENTYKSEYGIDDKQMQTLITQANLKYTPMSFPTKDLMLFEEVESDFKTIIDHYGLNDNLFSREKASTFTNLSEGIKQAYQSTIIPESEEIALRYSQRFGLIEKDEFLQLDYSHINVLQTNEKERSEVLEKKANALSKLKELGMYTDEELKEIITFE
jgi:HK97 family phage portal protein